MVRIRTHPLIAERDPWLGAERMMGTSVLEQQRTEYANNLSEFGG